MMQHTDNRTVAANAENTPALFYFMRMRTDHQLNEHLDENWTELDQTRESATIYRLTYMQFRVLLLHYCLMPQTRNESRTI